MIISRTPVRVSFAGGGSDLKEYYLKYGGAVVSVTINKYIFLTMHPFFYEDRYFLKYSKSERIDKVDQIEHPIIKAVFKEFGIKGVDFSSSADIPSGTGLGSSSSFTAGLIHLCNAYTGKYMNKKDMAEFACKIEIEKLGEPIGKQDQYAAAIGGLNYIQFNDNDTVDVESIVSDNNIRKKLNDRLLIFYVGGTRKANSILTEQRANIIDGKRLDNLHKMVGLAKDLKIELQKGNIDSMGDILDAGWQYKRELATDLTNKEIDEYYSLAMSGGASGGKLLGAGGNGFLLFYVKPENKEKLRNSLKNLLELKYEFDDMGTTIIY
jgi:D-glycero-alpha-D-manno-heptose-7-phosphate kinase